MKTYNTACIPIFQVNSKAAGKAAIHCASVAGNLDIIKCLLEFSPDLEIKVSQEQCIVDTETA